MRGSLFLLDLARGFQKDLLRDAELGLREAPKFQFSCLLMSYPSPFLSRLNCCRSQHAQPPLTPPAIAPERPMECCRRALDSVTMLRADITTRAGETQKSQDRQ